MSKTAALRERQPCDDSGHDILAGIFATARVDGARELAAALLAEFGSLARALSAGVAAQVRVIGDRPDVLRCLVLVRQAMLHALATEMSSAPILDGGSAVTDYLHVAMAHEPREQIRVLFLDVRNRLICDEVVTHGSVASAACEPREIMRRALEVGAVGLVLAHNHPSGNPQPSRDDIIITRKIGEAGRALGVTLHDHIIVAHSGQISFRSQGLM